MSAFTKFITRANTDDGIRSILPMEDDLMKYSDSELMESDTTTRDGILSQINPLNFLGFLTNIYTGGLSNALTTSGAAKLFSNILEAGRNTPNYQFVNPNKPNFNRIASDFYDPKTGLDRFDRAKTLFGQSRTLAEFLDKRREQKIRELDLEEKRRLSTRIPSGGDSEGSDPTAPGGPQSMGSAQGGAGGRPY
jgi:hypothetical protein|tara:strand:- start:3 stop:581 length:579 start_codon:yes stop_codon:yes gene_type:complete